MEDDDVKTLSRREVLEAAWAETEEKDDESPRQVSGDGENEAAPPEEGGDGEAVRAGDDKAGVQKTVAPPKKEGKSVDKAVEQELKASKRLESGKAPAAPQPPAPEDKAPGAWKPEIRQLWAQVPAEVREEIKKRELEIERTLTQTGTMRKFATDFATMVAPYQHLIRAQGSTPLQAVSNMMQTAAGLAQGNPQQKAEVIAQIMSNYGVDVQLLDQVLTKSYNPQTAQYNQQQNSAPPAWAQPIFQWMQRAEQQQQNYEEQQRAQADREIQELSTEPFFDDLREDMADLMEFAAKRGKVMGLKEAYQKAVELNPEVSKLVKQRAAPVVQTNSISQAAATLARARRAAKTISGAPRSEGSGVNKPKNRREMLSEAWDEKFSA